MIERAKSVRVCFVTPEYIRGNSELFWDDKLDKDRQYVCWSGRPCVKGQGLNDPGNEYESLTAGQTTEGLEPDRCLPMSADGRRRIFGSSDEIFGVKNYKIDTSADIILLLAKRS